MWYKHVKKHIIKKNVKKINTEKKQDVRIMNNG